MSAAGNCSLEETRRAQRWRFTVEYGDSAADSCPHLDTASWRKRDRHTDGDLSLSVEIQVEIHVASRKLHVAAKEVCTELEIHDSMWRFRQRFMFAAGNCILQQKR